MLTGIAGMPDVGTYEETLGQDGRFFRFRKARPVLNVASVAGCFCRLVLLTGEAGIANHGNHDAFIVRSLAVSLQDLVRTCLAVVDGRTSAFRIWSRTPGGPRAAFVEALLERLDRLDTPATNSDERVAGTAPTNSKDAVVAASCFSFHAQVS